MSGSRPCPSTLRTTPLPERRQCRPTRRGLPTQNDQTVSRGRHKSQRKERKKGGQARPPTWGHSHTVPCNTCSCTALLITRETAGPSELTHNAGRMGRGARITGLGPEFYTVKYFNLLPNQGTFRKFSPASVLRLIPLFIYSAHLRETAP